MRAPRGGRGESGIAAARAAQALASSSSVLGGVPPGSVAAPGVANGLPCVFSVIARPQDPVASGQKHDRTLGRERDSPLAVPFLFVTERRFSRNLL